MNSDTINYISSIAFVVIIGFFAVVSLLAIYAFIRYGRNRSITIATSLAFAALFIIGTATAFFTLQKIF